MGNSVRFPHGKPAATESRYPTLISQQVHMLALFVFEVLNPPNCDMDYKIFNVRT